MISAFTTILNVGKTFVVRKMSRNSFKGVPLDQIYRGFDEWHFDHLPPIANKRDHIVLFQLPIVQNPSEPPEPHRGENKWDSNHVRLPCSHLSEYKTECESDSSKTVTTTRWEIIQNALLRDIKSSRDLERAILSYNPKYAREWKFRSLHALFEEELEEDETDFFFSETLPQIIQLALQLPDIVPTAIPLLKRGQNKSISMSQQQVACLLANAFLCTFPRRNELKSKSEYASYPTINFNTLFQTTGNQNIEKIKCICTYFRRVCQKMPKGVITFQRRSISDDELPDWKNCHDKFTETLLHVSEEGTIEDDGEGLLQVDFANKYLGGGVLNYGCVQEEIRFMICPELLVSRLFTEKLSDNECMTIMGCERFNSYRGYASTFEWIGHISDRTPFDSFNRRKCTIVAIDAVPFRAKSHQFKEDMLKRELNKAYIGFKHDLSTPAPGVATGNWGCGAFSGDKHLKSLLQLIACCYTKRPLVYYTFGDVELRDELFMIYEYLKNNDVKIGQLFHCLKRYAERGSRVPLYHFIISWHQEYKDRISRTNGQSSNQANRSEVKTTEKPKRTSNEQNRSSTEQKPERLESVSTEDTEYHIEDSDDDNDDDDQHTVDEILDVVKETDNAFVNTRPRKKIQTNTNTPIMSKTLPPSTSGSRTISSFIQSSANVSETQEKQPISALLESLDEYDRKSPAKMKRASYSFPKRELSLNSPLANSTVIDIDVCKDTNQNETINKTVTVAEIHAEPKHHDSNDLFTSDSEDIENAMLGILTDDDDEPVADAPNEQNIKTSDKSSSNVSTQSTSGYLNESKCHQDDSQLEANADSIVSSSDLKSANSINKQSNKQIRQTTIKNYFDIDSPSQTSDSSSLDKSMLEADDRSSSDLNSEANQLEALHMASDK